VAVARQESGDRLHPIIGNVQYYRYPSRIYQIQKEGSNMLKGEAKKNYQRSYMKEYMRNKRAKQVKTPLFDVKTSETEPLVKTQEEVKTLLSPPVKTQLLPKHLDPDYVLVNGAYYRKG
jgi:hypothetical protein